MTTTNIITMSIFGLILLFFYIRFFFGGKNRKKLEEKLKGNVRVIDVRTSGEYKKEHYPKAINIPVKNLMKNPKRAGKPGIPIVVYCDSGTRSRQAARILRMAGYSDVTNGGAWKNFPGK